MYKKIKKGRKEQVKITCENIANKNIISHGDIVNMSYDIFYMNMDTCWKRLFPINNSYDAIKVSEQTIKRMLCLDVSNEIKMKDLVTIYFNLFYLEDFINKSVVQNNNVSFYYSYIKDYLYRYESGSDYMKIRY